MQKKGLPAFIQKIITLVVLILIFPFFIGIIFLILIFDKFPIFFSQTRIGKEEKPFQILKFRTMNKAGNVTFLGKFLRKYSLDELPQLLNIIKGDMLLVGPRPLLPEYLPLYSEKQKKRHLIKPGLSGWAQIKGRNTLSWQKKFELDVWYVENQSWILDLKIIVLTIKKIFIRPDGEIFAETFNGKN
ncbi:MAG: sugar transferase [Bacteroidetes bacterium]|nr:MAG: sugar transferase [Bacteroidota bacterium]